MLQCNAVHCIEWGKRCTCQMYRQCCGALAPHGLQAQGLDVLLSQADASIPTCPLLYGMCTRLQAVCAQGCLPCAGESQYQTHQGMQALLVPLAERQERLRRKLKCGVRCHGAPAHAPKSIIKISWGHTSLLGCCREPAALLTCCTAQRRPIHCRRGRLLFV